MTSDPVVATTTWEQRIAERWAAIDEYEPAEFRARVEALAAELP